MKSAISLALLITSLGSLGQVQASVEAVPGPIPTPSPMPSAGPVNPTCAVPVCDIPKELARFRVMKQGERYAALTNYHSTYKNSSDLAALKNLYEFAVGLEALFKDVHEEDWMVREVKGMESDCLLGLSKYSQLDAKVLASYYKQVSGETNRFSIVTFWKERIKEYEDKKSLMELIKFFGAIGKISKDDGDAEYVYREARAGEDIITTRIIQLYPYFEGVYRVKVSCLPLASQPGSVAPALPSLCKDQFIDRLVIMDTLGANKMEVSLVNQASGTILYTFTEIVVSQGGTTFESVGSPSGVLSQLHIVYDKENNKVTGFVRNSDSLYTLQIEGSQIDSPASVFDYQGERPNDAPVSMDTIARVYRGSYGDKSVTFTIQHFGEDNIGATMSLDSVPGSRVHFQFSRYYGRAGVLVLVGAQPNGSVLKLTLFFQPRRDGGVSVFGQSFSNLTGALQTITLDDVPGTSTSTAQP